MTTEIWKIRIVRLSDCLYVIAGSVFGALVGFIFTTTGATDPLRVTFGAELATSAMIAIQSWAVGTSVAFFILFARYRAVAWRDELTGLVRREIFDDTLAHAIRRALRSGKAVGLIAIDFDDFKPINTIWGHAQGNAVLRRQAERLLARARGGDVVGRDGGDELVVLVVDVESPRQLRAVAQRYRAALEEPVQLDISGGGSSRVHQETVRVGASIGTAYAAGPALDAADLRALADKRMRADKRRRKHRRAEEAKREAVVRAQPTSRSRRIGFVQEIRLSTTRT